MKLAFALLLLISSQATDIDYTSLISGMLEGSQLIPPYSSTKCNLSQSKSSESISFTTLIIDSISFSKACGWASATKTLSMFLNHPSLLSKAEEDLNTFLKFILYRSKEDPRTDGFTLGQMLEYRIASLSPFVNQFTAKSEEGKRKLQSSPYPIAVFHGLGDCCCFPGMIEFTKYLGKEAATFAKCVEVGDGPASSWLMGFQKQVNSACANMNKYPEFQNGVNVVGLSQGGLIARALAEMCNITVHNVITMGGPHMGVMSIPNCETGFYCDIFNDVIELGVYDSFVQENTGPAGYFKDPLTYNEYLAKSEFLAAANNEKSINTQYANGFKAINQLVLIEFTEDTVVDPKTSEQFGYFKIGSKKDLLLYNQTDDYINDILGLKTLDEQGKIVFEYIVGNHLQFNNSEVQRTVIPYLVN